MINWLQNFVSSNSVCYHISAMRSSDFVNHSYDYRPNWTLLRSTLRSITINLSKKVQLNNYKCVILSFALLEGLRKKSDKS